MSSAVRDVPRLTRRHYLILVALAGGPRHGYAIKKEIARLTGDQLRVGAGNLYRSLRQLAQSGLVEEAPDRPHPALDDERRVYYQLTQQGLAAAKLEADRLRELVRVTARQLAHD